MFGEKENYKFWRILEADTINEAEMKEKLRKEYSDERENSKSISGAGSSSKRYTPVQSLV